MPLTRRLAVFLPLLAAGCAGRPSGYPPISVSLPEGVDRGIADPTRGAILSSASVFGQPRSVAGNPAAAAEALGQLEYLTVELDTGPRWRQLAPIVGPLMQQGRAQARQVFGIRAEVPPQVAVNAFYGAAAALRAQDQARAAAALAVLAGEQEVPRMLQMLDALPYIPAAAAATARAQAEMDRDDRGRGIRI
jgi:hypothetical protein